MNLLAITNKKLIDTQKKFLKVRREITTESHQYAREQEKEKGTEKNYKKETPKKTMKWQ